MGVDAYRDELGMLPEAVGNYLLRLGWGHGDEEMISLARAVELFDLPGVGRSPSRFDLKKLENMNGHYMREADDARLGALAGPLLERDGLAVDAALLESAMPSLKLRAKTVHEVADGARFLFTPRPIPIDAAAKLLLDDAAFALITNVADRLGVLTDWTLEGIETAVRAAAEDAGIGLGKVAQPLRVALTGRTTSPGIFDVVFLLGKDETMARLSDMTHCVADGQNS
jgi:glutamyl-tRNA synthetase